MSCFEGESGTIVPQKYLVNLIRTELFESARVSLGRDVFQQPS